MKTRLFGTVLAAALVCAVTATAASPIRVMLLDGEQAGAYHAWQETTPYLQRMLNDAGLFQVDVVTAPPPNADFSSFKPDWSKYQVVVFNYDAPDERWPEAVKASFEQYVRNGGGLVSVHAADNAFANWKAYNLMIGVGGWRGRNQQSGPHFTGRPGRWCRTRLRGPLAAMAHAVPTRW